MIEAEPHILTPELASFTLCQLPTRTLEGRRATSRSRHQEFQSLRDVTFKPGDLSVLIGPNGAGKSNLCEALDFVGEMYRFGVDDAIADRGGFERIRFRQGDASSGAVLDWLKEHEPRAFSGALQCVQIVWPTLEEIDVVRTPHSGIQLLFREAGFDQPWSVHEVSEGTLRALGLFTAVFDPSTRVVVIEEPENSLHPWAVWRLIEVCREESEAKQFILTTHSPDLVDYVRPEEIWIVSKRDGATSVDPLDEIDPVARSGWEEGHFTLAEYIDTGLVPGSVPAVTR